MFYCSKCLRIQHFAHLNCNLNVILAQVGNVHFETPAEFFKVAPSFTFTQVSRIHMVTTRACLQNVSLLQNSPPHRDQIDVPLKRREPVARCWPLGGRLATESKSGSSHSAAGRDAHWGWVSSFGEPRTNLEYSWNAWKYSWNASKYSWNAWKYSWKTWKSSWNTWNYSCNTWNYSWNTWNTPETTKIKILLQYLKMLAWWSYPF